MAEFSPDSILSHYRVLSKIGAGEMRDVYLAALAHAHALAGKRAEAEKGLAELKELSKRRFVSEASIAMVYIALGDKDLAFAWLDTADKARDALLARLTVDPRFDGLRSDPRFADLVRRQGLPQ